MILNRLPAPHDLVLLHCSTQDLCLDGPGPLPDWATASLQAAAWAVVRRAPILAQRPAPRSPQPRTGTTRRTPAAQGHWIPLGVRGKQRGDRLALYAPLAGIAAVLPPEDLTARHELLPSARVERIPALTHLRAVCGVLLSFGLNGGPGGSVGFELATGLPATRAGSDLDLIVRAPQPVSRTEARALQCALRRFPVRVDAQLITRYGAVALAEYASPRAPHVLLRTDKGRRLVSDPWYPDTCPTPDGPRPGAANTRSPRPRSATAVTWA